jgi:hypothetical protein
MVATVGQDIFVPLRTRQTVRQLVMISSWSMKGEEIPISVRDISAP